MSMQDDNGKMGAHERAVPQHSIFLPARAKKMPEARPPKAKEHSVLPDRDPRAANGYALASLRDLNDILASTKNAYEFFAAFLQRYCAQDDTQKLAEAMGYKDDVVLRDIANGINLPSKFLPGILRVMANRAGPALAERFEDLIILNRLQIIRAAPLKDENKVRSIGIQLERMPQTYWEYVLEEFANRQLPENVRKGLAPKLWSDEALLIGCTSDYVRALHLGQGMNAPVAAKTFGIHRNYLSQLEEGVRPFSQTMLVRIFEKLPGFDASALDGAPYGRSAWYAAADAVHGHRNAQQRRRDNAAQAATRA